MAAIDPSQFVQDNQELDDFLCHVCKKVVVLDAEPVLCKDEHLFCRGCIIPLICRADSSCPVDGAPLRPEDLTSSKRTARAASRLAVKCNHYASGKSLRVALGQVPGCRWHGSVHELGEHLLHCEYRPVDCMRCSEKVQHRAQRLHDMYCANLEEPCTMCGESVPLRDAKLHLETCDGVCVPCPNLCLRSNCTRSSTSALADVTFILRKDVDAHRAECPFERVTCPFHVIGCPSQSKVTRFDLGDHMSAAVQSHIFLLLRALGGGLGSLSDASRRTPESSAIVDKLAERPSKKPRLNGISVLEASNNIHLNDSAQLVTTESQMKSTEQVRKLSDLVHTMSVLTEQILPLANQVGEWETKLVSWDKDIQENKQGKRKADFDIIRAHLKKLDDKFAAVNGEARQTSISLKKFKEDILKRVDMVDTKLGDIEEAFKLVSRENADLKKATEFSVAHCAVEGHEESRAQLQNDVQSMPVSQSKEDMAKCATPGRCDGIQESSCAEPDSSTPEKPTTAVVNDIVRPPSKSLAPELLTSESGKGSHAPAVSALVGKSKVVADSSNSSAYLSPN
jgi:TRAF-type zinc finger